MGNRIQSERYVPLGGKQSATLLLDRQTNERILCKTCFYPDLPSFQRDKSSLLFRCALPPCVYPARLWQRVTRTSLCHESAGLRFIVQEPSLSLREAALLDQSELIICLRDCLTGFYCLCKYYKMPFQVSNDMVFLSKRGQVFAWISADVLRLEMASERKLFREEGQMMQAVVKSVLQLWSQEPPAVLDGYSALDWQSLIGKLSRWVASGVADPTGTIAKIASRGGFSSATDSPSD